MTPVTTRLLVRVRDEVRFARSRQTARWESHCRRCGLCCYEKERRGRSVVTDYHRPCVHLDVSSRLCTVYENRFAICPQCRPMTLLHAMFVKWLPSSCGYVRRYRGRRAFST
jgi:uncharacterized protein